MAVFLDYNATTPLAPPVLDVITATLRDGWANPSSTHDAGRRARQIIEQARGSIARMIGTRSSSDIVFTSGGTESNAMVFESVARLGRPHVITTNLEHDSVLLTVQALQQQNKIELTVVRADTATGKVLVEDILKAIHPHTVLVSVMLANNETGIMQPVADIAKAVHKYVQVSGQKIYVHTDAAQALGKIPVDAVNLGVDYLTIVGHKFYGPRIGALYIRGLDGGDTPLYPIFHGGGQERGYRPGTENTGMIAGLGKAAELVADYVEEYQRHMRDIRDYLESSIEAEFGDHAHFNGRLAGSERIPNTSNISLVGEPLQGNRVMSLLKHCQVSLGAACHSQTASKPSQVLLAIGIPEAIAINALRISVGRETTREDIDVFIQDLKSAVGQLTA